MRTLVLVVALGGLAMACKRRAPEPAAPTAVSPPPAPSAGPDAAALPADYNPAGLVQDGADPVEVFLKQPRNAAWAGPVEDAVGGQLRRDLKRVVPEARGLSIGCRTLSCLIIVDVPADKRDIASVVLNLVTLGPITTDLGLTEDGKGQLLFMTEPRFADPAVFIGWYKRIRARALEEIKSGKRKNPLPMELE